jgi:diguanylate cyclase (GGDEF)-like protein
MPSRPLQYLRNAFFIIATLMIVACLAYFWSHYRGVENLRTEAERRLSIVSATLLTPTDKYGYLPTVIAAYPTISQTLLLKYDPEVIREGNQFLQKLNAETGLAVIYLMDESGMTIASSNWQDKDTFVGNNFSFRPYFQDAVKYGEGQFYAMGTISHVPGYYLSHAVRSGDVLLGVLVIKVNMNNLDSLDRVHIRTQSEVTVSDENGVIFLSTINDWEFRPFMPLDAEAKQKVKSTRQYEGVLKAPLQTTVEKKLSDSESIMSVRDSASGRGDAQKTYLVRAAPFSGSPWVVRVFLPMKPVDRSATRVAALSVVMALLLLLALMYLMEVRTRVRERERSRLALQQAHQALEQKHAELEKLSEDLRVVSITDALTGAYNRRYFIDTMVKAIAAANRADDALSIMMIDVDYFKRINDVFGHPVGDKVLQWLTALCKKMLRAEDVFARFGGEEFIIALPGTDERVASQVAERLRACVMTHPFEADGQEIKLTISCGVARYRAGESGIDEVIKRADDALYEAKSNGRNRVVVRI